MGEITPTAAKLLRWVLGVFAPPLAAAALYGWLTAKVEALPPAFIPKIMRMDPEQWELLLMFLEPLLALLASIALVIWLRRRLGWARALLVFWWLLCAASASIVWSLYIGRAWLEPVPAVQARALEVWDVASRMDSPGGVGVFMGSRAWPSGSGGVRVVMLEGASPGSVAPCSWLDLRMARGAWGTSYITGWSVAASAPVAAASSEGGYSCGKNGSTSAPAAPPVGQ